MELKPTKRRNGIIRPPGDDSTPAVAQVDHDAGGMGSRTNGDTGTPETDKGAHVHGHIIK
eukprot:6204444-Alexandrium_andersonii.AAC.1